MKGRDGGKKKKRKRERERESESEPVKKVRRIESSPSVEKGVTSYTLSVPANQVSNGGAPLLADFPNGIPLGLRQSDPQTQLKWEMYCPVSRSTPECSDAMILKAENESVEYVGRNFDLVESAKWNAMVDNATNGDEDAGVTPLIHKDSCQYAVALVNKETRVATVYGVSSVFSLYQHVKSVDMSHDGLSTDSSLDKASYSQKKGNLINMFGSKKRQRDEKRRVAHDISGLKEMDIKSSSQIRSVLSKRKEYDDQEQVSDITSQLPPFDSAATDKSKVYDLISIVKELKGKLDENDMMTVLEGEEDLRGDRVLVGHSMLSFLPTHCIMAIRARWSDMRKKKKKRTAAQLAVLAYLMRFFGFVREGQGTRTGKEVRVLRGEESHSSLSSNAGIPVPFIPYLLQEFTNKKRVRQQDTYFVDKKKKEKLLNFIIVFYLVLCDFDLPSGYLAKELMVSQDILLPHLRATGCTRLHKPMEVEVKSSKDPTSVRYTLKVPFKPIFSITRKQR